MILKDQTILITGAAGRIGSAIARNSYMEGATLLLADIDSKKLDKLSDEISPDRNNIYSICGDEESDCDSCCESEKKNMNNYE